MEKLFNIYDVASLLGLSINVVYKLMYKKGLPFCKLGINTRFNPDDIENYIIEHTIRIPEIKSQSQGETNGEIANR